MIDPYHGFSGPRRGGYFGSGEGSLRVPFLIRWPGHIPPGTVSNEILHEMDLFPTLARVASGKVPNDRIFDGVDQLGFLTGKQQHSGFRHHLCRQDIFGVKWRNWKMLTKTIWNYREPIADYDTPLFLDLYTDPKEEHPSDPRLLEDLWVRYPIFKALGEHLASLKKEPPIPPGTPDPYIPPPP